MQKDKDTLITFDLPKSRDEFIFLFRAVDRDFDKIMEIGITPEFKEEILSWPEFYSYRDVISDWPTIFGFIINWNTKVCYFK